jgi:hypothetical protein
MVTWRGETFAILRKILNAHENFVAAHSRLPLLRELAAEAGMSVNTIGHFNDTFKFDLRYSRGSPNHWDESDKNTFRKYLSPVELRQIKRISRRVW